MPYRHWRGGNCFRHCEEVIMAKFEVNRYLVVTSVIEAETAEDALEIESNTPTDVTITSPAGLLTTWWSDNDVWVNDEDGETIQ